MNRSAHTRTRRARLRGLEREVARLRSVVISIVGEDREGRYQPDFVKEILEASHEKPGLTFKDPHSFLAELDRA